MNESHNREFAAKIVRYAAVLTGVCLVSGAALSLLYYNTRDLIVRNELTAFLRTLEVVMGEVEALEVVAEWPGEIPVPEGASIVASGGDGVRYVTMGRQAFEERFKQVDRQRALFVGRTREGVRYVAMGAAQGYQSKISVLAAVDASEAGKPLEGNPVISGVAVMPSGETPGLGENIHQVKAQTSLWAALAGRGGGAGAERPWFQEQFSKKTLDDLPGESKWDTDKLLPITGATISSLATAKAVRAAVTRMIETTRRLYQ